MASAPFQTSGNVGDIAPVQLKGGFTPDTGIADAVVDVANTVLPVIRQNLEDELTEDVSGKAASVALALKATRFPSIQESVFSEAALADPQVALALKEFTLIQDAAKNGRLPATFALERLELIQNKAIKDSPAFEAEIRGAMRDATGVDPQKTLFQQLLSNTSGKSAEQKLQEKLHIQAGSNGVTVDEQVAMNHTAAEAQFQQDKFNLTAKQGNYTLNTLSSEIVSRGQLIMTDTMEKVNQLVVSGKPIGVEEKLLLSNSVNAAAAATIASLTANIARLNLDGTAVTKAMSPVMQQRDIILEMINNGTMQRMLTEHKDVLIKDAQVSFANNPEYGNLWKVVGTDGLLKFMDYKTKYGDSPQALALAKSFDKGFANLSEIDEILKQASRVGNGEVLETTMQKNARILAAGDGVANTAAGEEYQLNSLEDIKKYGGEELSWSGFSSNRWLTATAQSSKLKAAFINMQATTTAGLSAELVELSSTANVQLERLVLGTDGNLTVTPRTQAERVGLSATARDADASMATYVRRFNRANNISAKYHGAGVLPNARYSGSEAYWNTVKGAATDLVKPREEDVVKTRKVIRNPDGTLSFGDGK